MLLKSNEMNVARRGNTALVVLLAGVLVAMASPGVAAPAKAAATKAQGSEPTKAQAIGKGPGDIGIEPQCREDSGAPQSVRLRAGKSHFLKLSEPISRLTIGNDGLVDAKLVSPTSLYLVGRASGQTNMILQGASQKCAVFDVLVTFDQGSLTESIKTIWPNEQVLVEVVGDTIVLKGQVSNAIVAGQIESLAYSYAIRTARGLDAITSPSMTGGTSVSVGGDTKRTNSRDLVVNMLTVAAPQQVMLEVKVAEVSKKVLDEFGINFSRAFALADGSAIRFLNGILGGMPAVLGEITGTGPKGVAKSSVDAVVGGSLSGIGGNSAVGTAVTGGNVTVDFVSGPADPVTGRATIVPKYTTTYGQVPGRGVNNATLNMQKQDGLVKVLAEPTVMAISGQEGSFLAGGKIFIPTAQFNGTVTTYTLEEKEFGVSLRFRPTVLADGRINLQVNPEVSELSPTGVTIASATIGGTTVLPAFTTRKAATTVQLHDGQSFAIGGLMKSNVSGSINAFPILGELPVIGALFRSTSFQTDRSELVFVITPRLVKPLPPDYALPTDAYVQPTRSEVIFGGKLEGSPAEQTPPSSGGFERK